MLKEGTTNLSSSSSSSFRHCKKVKAMIVEREEEVNTHDPIPMMAVEAEEEGRLVESIMQQNTPPVEGSEWYVLNNAWWCRWKAYTRYQGTNGFAEPPGAINNNGILEPDFAYTRNLNARRKMGEVVSVRPGDAPRVVKRGLVQGVDFVVVPKAVWDLLVSKYGTGSVATPRYACHVYGTNRVEIDVFQVEILLTCSQREGIHSALRLSRNTTVLELKKRAMDSYKIDYNTHGDTTKLFCNHPLMDMSLQLCDAFQNADQVKVSLEPTQSLSLPPRPPATPRIFGLNHALAAPNQPEEVALMRVPGACGLENVGNTCYMNSILQCLSNIGPFADYITSGKFSKEINTNNPIGSHGKVINALADVFRNMWKEGNPEVYSPKEFKKVIGTANATYAGSTQQDARHFVECLLSEVHEDVNRVQVKPQIDRAPDFNGVPIEQQAEYCWARSLSSDKSFITDLFTGQMMDSTYCPACGHRAVSFENFRVSTAYIPWDGIKLTLTFNSLRGAERFPPLNVIIPCREGGTVASVAQAIAVFCNTRLGKCGVLEPFFPVAPENVVVMGVSGYETLSVKSLSERVSSSSSTRLYASVAAARHSQDFVRVALMFYDNVGISVGIPYVVTLRRETSYSEVAGELIRTFAVFTKDGELEKHLGFPLGGAPDFGNPRVVKALEGLLKINGKQPVVPGAAVRLTENEVLSVCLTEQGKGILKREWRKEAEEEHGDLTLKRCLGFRSNVFFVLDDDNRWTCNRCGNSVNAIKQNAFWRLPPVMILCLNRFISPDGSYANGVKHNGFIRFPTSNFDFSPFVQGPLASSKEELIYDLCAVSNHLGELAHGHYTATARNRKDRNWYYFDDSSVKAASSPVTENAYMLFYVRKDLLALMNVE